MWTIECKFSCRPFALVTNFESCYIMDEKINFAELRAQMPKKLNKLGEWYFSKDRTMFVEINDMKAVLK